LIPFALLTACAPLVAPVTLAAVVQHESGGHPLAVHDNAAGMSYRPRSEDEAVALAKGLIAQGHSVDLGLGQINSGNLAWLGQSVETIFKPCTNLAATQKVLLAAWRQAGGQFAGSLVDLQHRQGEQRHRGALCGVGLCHRVKYRAGGRGDSGRPAAGLGVSGV